MQDTKFNKYKIPQETDIFTDFRFSLEMVSVFY